jgi:hypothetical protein
MKHKVVVKDLENGYPHTTEKCFDTKEEADDYTRPLYGNADVILYKR